MLERIMLSKALADHLGFFLIKLMNGGVWAVTAIVPYECLSTGTWNKDFSAPTNMYMESKPQDIHSVLLKDYFLCTVVPTVLQ